LLAKATDYLFISSRKEQDLASKRLQDRLSDLEAEKRALKDEACQERERLLITLREVEDKRNDALKSEKVLEERLRQALAERERTEKASAEKLK